MGEALTHDKLYHLIGGLVTDKTKTLDPPITDGMVAKQVQVDACPLYIYDVADD